VRHVTVAVVSVWFLHKPDKPRHLIYLDGGLGPAPRTNRLEVWLASRGRSLAMDFNVKEGNVSTARLAAIVEKYTAVLPCTASVKTWGGLLLI